MSSEDFPIYNAMPRIEVSLEPVSNHSDHFFTVKARLLYEGKSPLNQILLWVNLAHASEQAMREMLES